MLGNKKYLYKKTNQETILICKANVNTATKQVTVEFSNENGIVFEDLTITFDIPNFDRHGDIMAQGYYAIKTNGYNAEYDLNHNIIGGWVDLLTKKDIDDFFGRTNIV